MSLQTASHSGKNQAGTKTRSQGQIPKRHECSKNQKSRVVRGETFCLMAFLVSQIGHQSSGLRLQLIARPEAAEPLSLRIRGLAADRLQLEHAANKSSFLPSVPTTNLEFEPLIRGPSTPVFIRIVEALGGLPLYHAQFDWYVPDLPQDTRYVGLALAPTNKAMDECWQRDEACYVERRKYDLGLGKNNHTDCYGFFVNRAIVKQQIDKVDEILRNNSCGYSGGDLDAHTLVKVFFNLYGGYDTPLLWRQTQIEPFVLAARGFVKKQMDRERWSQNGLRAGGRNVDNEFDLISIADYRAWEDALEDREKKVQIIQAQIRERIRSPSTCDLIEWHLFEAETIADLAKLFGVKYCGARTAVCRAKRYLHISRKQIKVSKRPLNVTR